jgi:rhodanese-related sulfurtransferase
VSVPGAELVYRFKDLVPSATTMVIVNCGGRTRSIIGAQSLINAGVPNKVVSLKDGTMAWHLSGFQVIQGADRRPPEVSPASAEAARRSVERVARGLHIPRIDPATLAAWRTESDRHSLYMLDVRTPEEYEAGHVAGIRSAPGGQLVQETDNYLATWGARVVLADTDDVRAVMTASWLKQMGWSDVAVVRLEDVPGSRVTGPHRPLALGLEPARVAMVSPAELKQRLEAATVTLIDLEYSKTYRNGHIPGAWFATRTRLGATLDKIPLAEGIVLTSSDGDLARIAAAELSRTVALPVHALEDGTRGWTLAGYPLAKGADRMAETPDDVWLPARERGGDRESAMRAYLAWEIDLVNQMATDDDQRFNVVTI